MYIDNNPLFELDYTSDPFIVAKNDGIVAINSALQVDLTGQVCSDSIGYFIYSGFGGQVDFIRGAARAKGGKPIIALPSTAKMARSPGSFPSKRRRGCCHQPRRCALCCY